MGGERLAVREGGRRQSFAELRARVRRRRSGLAAAGIGAGDRVAVLLPTGGGFVEVVHAVDAAGATLLPLHLRQSEDELAFQLADANARALIHGDGALRPRAEALHELVGTPLLPLAALDGPPGEAGAPVDPEAALGLLYTSGTTGRPKGALLSRRAFRASARASAALLGVQPGDCWLVCLPLQHVAGLSLLTRSVLHGTSLLLHDGFDPERVSDAVDREGIAGVSLVPSMLARVLDARADRPPPSRLRRILLGGAAAPAPLLARAAEAGFPVAPTYGLTEATSQVATRLPGRTGGLTPLPGLEVRVADDDGHRARAGEPGEIVLRGATLFSGYVGRPVASAEALRDGWLRTGDVGRFDADGGLHVLDRRLDLIVSGGENVYPAEIERVLLEHPEVVDAGVAGAPDARFGARPVAWVVLRREPPPDLRGFCRKRLASYKVPLDFHAVARLPRNTLGKLERHRLGGKALEEGVPQ